MASVRFVGVLCVLAVLGVLQAQAASMSDLLQGGSISCGDKTFTNFRNFTSVAAGGADAPTAAQVFVSSDAGTCGTFEPGPGLLFQSAVWNVNAGGTIDTAFTFDVFAPGPLIHDAVLAFVSFDAQGGGEIHISESLFDSLNNSVQNLSVDSLTGPTTDHHIFPGGLTYSKLTVNKDISLEGHTDGNATLSTFTQNFSEVPEPATLSMLGLGILLVGSYRPRRSATK